MLYVWSKLSASKWQDAWEERLRPHGSSNLVITELSGRKTIRLELYCDSESDADRVKKLFGGSVRLLKEQNWVAMSKPDPVLLKIRSRLLVTSETDVNKLEDLRKTYFNRPIIVVPPDLAFGTGEHATTSTCLRFLVDMTSEMEFDRDWNFLDLGTGTGILAMAAWHLGARQLEAWEYDPLAIQVAKKNFKVNGLPRGAVGLKKVDVLEWEPPEPCWDFIAANLFSDVLVQIFPAIRKALKPDGRLIVSGILKEQAPACLAGAKAAGLPLNIVQTRGKWVSARS